MTDTLRKFVFFGDGLISSGLSMDPQGFGFSLINAFELKADILFRGFSGYNTSEIKNVSKPISTLHPNLVIFGFGNSDSVLEGQIQHIPEEKFESNLQKMAEEVAVSGAWPVLITPVAPNEARIKSKTLLHTRQYALATRRVAESLQTEVIDLFHAMQLCDDWEHAMLLNDGTSLSANGHQLLAKLCLASIKAHFNKSNLPRLSPSLQD